MLGAEMPIIQPSIHRVLYWSDAEQLLDFTTKDDVAAYVAAAALDETTPRILRIAGDSVSARHRKCNERCDGRALSNDVGRQHRVARRHDTHR